MLGLALREILARRENGLRFGDAIILVSMGTVVRTTKLILHNLVTTSPVRASESALYEFNP
jgi:hypothetical protein